MNNTPLLPVGPLAADKADWLVVRERREGIVDELDYQQFFL
jgi:hypothetical protein